MKYKLKVGDKVWVKIPVNATVVKVDEKYGYTIKPDTEIAVEMEYYDDNDVQKLDSEGLPAPYKE